MSKKCIGLLKPTCPTTTQVTPIKIGYGNALSNARQRRTAIGNTRDIFRYPGLTVVDCSPVECRPTLGAAGFGRTPSRKDFYAEQGRVRTAQRTGGLFCDCE